MTTEECFVMVPIGDGLWASVCFVEVDGLPDTVDSLGRHAHEGTMDHRTPRSQPLGECPGHKRQDGHYCRNHDDPVNKHAAHRACQNRQGNAIRAHKMTPEERKAFGRMARKGGLKGGALTFERGTGIFSGQTHEERVASGRKAGLKGGALTFERGIGIHAQTPEERKAFAGMGGLKGGLKAAHTRWHVKRGVFNPACAHCTEVAS